jgi:TolB protein
MHAGVAVLLLLLASVGRAEDRLQIEVHRPGRAELRFAVQRFHPEPGLDGDFRELLYRNLTEGLEYSGLVRVIDPGAFLEPTETEDDRRSIIPCDNWGAIGADSLTEGSITSNRGRMRVRFRLWDVPRCQMQGDPGIFEAPVDQVAWLGRRIADELILRFTGRQGVSATQIAFVSDRSKAREVYLMEADGSGKTLVTNNGSINLFPGWTPDGKGLLYTSYRSGAPDLFYLARGAKRSKTLVDRPQPKYRAVYSPKGDKIAVVMAKGANTDIFISDRKGRKLRRLPESPAIDVSPTWSPDGTQLAFMSDRSGSPQIHIHEFKSGQTRRLTFRGDYNASPAWSPTGEWIVFSARTGTNFDLYLISPDSGYTTPLVVHPRGDEEPTWSPDGRKVAFVSSRRGAKEVYTVDLDGSNLRRLTPGFGSCTAPAWSPWLE